MELEKVFAEKRSYAVQHVFMPAIIYYYTQDIYKVFTIIYLYESFEYLYGQLDDNWGELPGDSLVGDILMAILGMIAISQFKYVKKHWWYIPVHVTVLALASGVSVIVLLDEIIWAYVIYGITATVMAFLISWEWALFSLINIVIIAAIATKLFTQPFSHTPIATLISLPITTLVLFMYKKIQKNEVQVQLTKQVKTTPSSLKEIEWRYARC